MKCDGEIPEATLRRYPKYLAFARALAEQEWDYVTSADIARACDVTEMLIRKDMTFTGVTGRPHLGYPILGLIAALTEAIGWDRPRRLVIAGAGKVSETLADVFPFARYNVTPTLVVSEDPAFLGKEIHGMPVVSPEEFRRRQQEDPVSLAVLTTGGSRAQHVSDDLVEHGVKAIWNFTDTSLTVPSDVVVVDAAISSDLAVLSRCLTARSL